MSKDKTHYRKVFKSDHLGSADLEEFIEEKVVLNFTISYVKQEIGATVAGKKGNFNIAYFKEPIKPLVLNATNSKMVQSLVKNKSPFVEDWKEIAVELYIERGVRLGRETVSGVRLKKPSDMSENTQEGIRNLYNAGKITKERAVELNNLLQ